MDEITVFIGEHKKWLIFYCIALIFGLVIGILSALKPIDPLVAFSSHNVTIYAVIEQASYLQFIFSSLFFVIAVVVLTSFLGRFSYSTILLVVMVLVLGYFQGGTVVFVIRIYGVIGIPFVICYSVTTLLLDLIMFAHFAVLAHCAYEARKYGCRAPFMKILLGSVYILILSLMALIVKYILVILLSFFL